MEISLKTFVLFAAVVVTGLSAGLFFAWSVSVIPGTLKLPDHSYLQAMQSINRAILNPVFFFIFFGSAALLSISSIYEFHAHHQVFWIMLAASVAYLAGTVGITGLGNVPLNDQLEALQLNEMSATELQEFRLFYEIKWNQLHLIRTIFAVISFLLSVLAVFASNYITQSNFKIG